MNSSKKARVTAAIASNLEVLRFVGSHWMRQRRLFVIAGALTIAWTSLDVMIPVASSHVIAAVAAGHGDIRAAWNAWLMFIGAFAGYAVARNVTFRLWSVVAARNMESITNEVFSKLQSLPMEWHATHLAGETVRKVVRAMWGYDAVTDTVTIWLGPACVVLSGLVVLVGVRNWISGVIAGAIITTFVIVNIILTEHYIRPANLRSNALDGTLSGKLTDAVTSNSVVRSFAAEEREARKISRATAAWRYAITRTWMRFINIGFAQNLCLLVLLVGLTGSMLLAWTRGSADPGDVAFTITTFMLMSGYLRNIGDNVRMLQRGIDDTASALVIWRESSEPGYAAADGQCHKVASLRKGVDLSFDRVRFAYPGTDVPVCNDLSMRICAGEVTAIVGASGAGKSTLIRLAQRFYEIQFGRILLDGVDIRTMPLPELRRAIAVAPQFPELFHRTVFENIAYGRPGATHYEVIAAAKSACADEFIRSLPQGYETRVGERGAKLSGGQRQRIALARALLADSPIVVLDEATSALDPETEHRVLTRLRNALGGRTCLIITHRNSVSSTADKVLRFARGQVSVDESNEPSDANAPGLHTDDKHEKLV
ncbi:ABC transporter ATP-binding protein [Paraburkholderia sp. 22B1P]|uniref:ABC transporter ATP-binding protein n=1 Tax=Paraburkholderia sp. 22B1P TaxID=3080498 RepID=UPI00308E7013|nr:ABC transporter ATP-binding protein [Paraburkholderia sp. 22B1P]